MQNWCASPDSLKPMYIHDEERKLKIGKVSVFACRDNYIKLRFTHSEGKRDDLNISLDTDEGWINAFRMAQIINAGIESGQFDLNNS